MHTTHTLNIGFASFLFLRDWSGAERITATLAKALLARGHRVTIIVEAGGAEPAASVPVSPVPEGGEVLELELATPQGQQRARDALKAADFDVVVTLFGGRNLLWIPWLLKDTTTPLLVGECIHPQVMTYERWHPYEHYGALMAADRIQVLLPTYVEQYPQALQGRIKVIGNPSPAPVEVNKAERMQRQEHILLGVGRFEDSVKQFSLLLRAWMLLAPEFPDWQLVLVGDGPQWGLYTAMVEAMGKDARVTLTGSVADPGRYYAQADIFCMPSKQESFGMVLTEAAAYGLPLVGFASCEAAADLIAPGTGKLAEEDNPASLAEALRTLMGMDAEERLEIGLTAQKVLGERFAAEQVFDAWEALLIETAFCKGHTQLLELDGKRWDEAILTQAALELVARPHPLGPALDDADTDGGAAALARLQSEKEALERDLKRLQQKYDGLLAGTAATRGRAPVQPKPPQSNTKKRPKKRK